MRSRQLPDWGTLFPDSSRLLGPRTVILDDSFSISTENHHWLEGFDNCSFFHYYFFLGFSGMWWVRPQGSMLRRIHKIGLPPTSRSSLFASSSSSSACSSSFVSSHSLSASSAAPAATGIRYKCTLAVNHSSKMARLPAQQTRPVHATSTVSHPVPV